MAMAASAGQRGEHRRCDGRSRTRVRRRGHREHLRRAGHRARAWPRLSRRRRRGRPRRRCRSCRTRSGVGDSRQARSEPEVYIPAGQVDVDAAFFWPQTSRSFARAPIQWTLVSSIRRAVAEVDPDEPVANIRTMNDVFDSDLLKRNTQMTLVAVFAGLALAMASYRPLRGALLRGRTTRPGNRRAPRARRRATRRYDANGPAPGSHVGADRTSRWACAAVPRRRPADRTAAVPSVPTLRSDWYSPARRRQAPRVALLACWLPARRAAAVRSLVATRAGARTVTRFRTGCTRSAEIGRRGAMALKCGPTSTVVDVPYAAARRSKIYRRTRRKGQPSCRTARSVGNPWRVRVTGRGENRDVHVTRADGSE